MKQVSAFSLAFTVAGCVLGAGYVSGQELWQFFGIFGKSYWWWLPMAFLIFGIFCYITVRVVQLSGEYQFGRLVLCRPRPFLCRLLGLTECFFLFGIYVIMTAGVSALGQQMTTLPGPLSGALFCLVVSVWALLGVGGMVRAFSVVVPVLTVLTLLFCAMSVKATGVQPAMALRNEGRAAFSAFTYVAYNLFCTIGVLAPVAKRVKDRKTALLGSVLGAALLFVTAAAIVTAQGSCNGAVDTELPMLTLAERVSPFASRVYAVLLLAAMFATSLSSLVAVVSHSEAASPIAHKKRIGMVVLISLAAFGGSFIGFSRIIGILYPICGYLSIVVLAELTRHFWRLHHRS